MLQNQTFETTFAGRTLSVEVGKVAHQTNASCLVRYGDSVVLATAVMSNQTRDVDFFPLQVEVREKMYASGKIKGSRFVKGEGRPTDHATLDARMIDRGLRPLFNQKLRNEVQVVITTLSYDRENPIGLLGITAASLALHLSDIPWQGPIAGIQVARNDGKLVLNPTVDQITHSDLNLVLSIVDDKVIMVDADAQEVSEKEMSEAFAFGIQQAQSVLAFIQDVRQKVGLDKQDEQALIDNYYSQFEISLAEKQQAFELAKTFFSLNLDKYLFNQPKGTKRERKEVAKALLSEYLEKDELKEAHPEIKEYIKNEFEEYLEQAVSQAILDQELRVDGRTLTQIRPLLAEVGLLPRTHGTGLFSRGETQVMSIVTLGSPGDAQIMDEMTQDDTKKHYMHFYNCPPYAFGEAGAFRGAGRREIGHGALAEKALIPVLPTKDDFPYTILVVSEVMGSNGSSSMASTCGSTLALMDAGVPLKKPVAGIAMGLASNDQTYRILTDLQDLEDGPGGMDFKITGTEDGITAIQMDTKTQGLSLEICQKTIDQAKQARLEILDVMAKAIAEPRSELSEFAPRIISFRIEPEKIGEVIGPSGKVINAIIDECQVEIDIEDDGLVMITGLQAQGAAKAQEIIQNIVKEVEVGEIYDGKVTRIMDFGAFVQILPGKEGMVHISEFSNQRVDKIGDVAKIGDVFKVKVIEIDRMGRINLSVKQADPKYQPDQDSRRRKPNDRGPQDRRQHKDRDRRNFNKRR